MTIRILGTVKNRKTNHGVPGWKIITKRSKKGLGFFAPDTEIRRGYKPNVDDEVIFTSKLVAGRRYAFDVLQKKEKSKVRSKLRHVSVGALVVIILAFVIL